MTTRTGLIEVLERSEDITLAEDHPVWRECLERIVEAQTERARSLLDDDEPAKPTSIIAKRKPKPAVRYEPAPSDACVAEYIGDNPGMAADTIAEFFGCATAGISAAVKRLEKANFIRTSGTHRGKRYYPPIADVCADPADDGDGHDHAAAIGAQEADAGLTFGGQP